MLIIDGYNLIHAIGLLPAAGRSVRYEPGVLERAREKMLELVIKDLPESWRPETTVVFDALEPPEFLPNSYQRSGVHIVFARDYQDADEMIIEMVLNAQRGESVVVISSDHRIQATVRRRHFIYRDSDKWYFGGMQLPERGQDAAPPKTNEKPNPDAPLSKEETEYWLKYFKK